MAVRGPSTHRRNLTVTARARRGVGTTKLKRGHPDEPAVTEVSVATERWLEDEQGTSKVYGLLGCETFVRRRQGHMWQQSDDRLFTRIGIDPNHILWVRARRTLGYESRVRHNGPEPVRLIADNGGRVVTIIGDSKDGIPIRSVESPYGLIRKAGTDPRPKLLSAPNQPKHARCAAGDDPGRRVCSR